jgi:hypothetical protein
VTLHYICKCSEFHNTQNSICATETVHILLYAPLLFSGNFVSLMSSQLNFQQLLPRTPVYLGFYVKRSACEQFVPLSLTRLRAFLATNNKSSLWSNSGARGQERRSSIQNLERLQKKVRRRPTRSVGSLALYRWLKEPTEINLKLNP